MPPRIHWRADGLRTTLLPADPLPWLSTPRLVFGLVAIWAVLGGAFAERLEASEPAPLPALPAACRDTPWECPGAVERLDGLPPQTAASLVYAVAAGRLDLGDEGMARMCTPLFRGGSNGMGNTNLRCLEWARDRWRAGELVLPGSVPPSGRAERQAQRWRGIWENHLRGLYAAERARAEAAREEEVDAAEAATARHQATRQTALTLAAGATLGLLLVAGWRRARLQPVTVEVTPRGIRVDRSVFPRTAIRTARLTHDALRIRLEDGRTFESRRLAPADRTALSEALQDWVLDADAILEERDARPAVEGALDPLRRR